MERPQIIQLANDLVKLAREFKTQEPEQASELKKSFKRQSHNDLARVIVYLMEVVGVSDMRLKTVQQENKDLREILELNNIKLGEENEKTSNNEEQKATEENISATGTGNVEENSSVSV